MKSTEWQDETIDALQRFFAAAPGVQAVALFGSNRDASAPRDEWSDIDVLVVVDTDALPDYHPNIDWIEGLGELYAYEQSSGPYTHATRCHFRDGRRIDFIFTTAAAIADVSHWPHCPWWNGARVLFSRSETASAALTQRSAPAAPTLPTPASFAEMLRLFRFKGLLAVQKIARRDLLIALHLVLEMQQDCCVLGMILRDRAEGSSHHREGGIGNDFVARLQAGQFPFTADGLLATIEQAASVFDDLSFQWTADYTADNAPLQSEIEKARRSIHESSSEEW